jgi:hypothetical protein
MTSRTFLSQHPLFGTKNKPLPLRYQERSVYYWWWEYLRREETYSAWCDGDRSEDYSVLFNDFGDVRQTDFRTWWTQDDRGARLFAEQPREIRQIRLLSKDEWKDDWSLEEAAVFVIPLNVGRRKIQSLFAKQLAKIHTGRRGRVSLASTVSTSLYPLVRNFNVHSLKLGLTVYDACQANQLLPKEEKLPMWGIGEKLKLIQSALPEKDDTKYETTNKRNVMTVAVSRYMSQTSRMVENTSLGRFPDSTTVN